MPRQPWIDAATLLSRLHDAAGEDLPERFAAAVPSPADAIATDPPPSEPRLGGDVAIAAAAAARYDRWMTAIAERDADWFEATFAPELVVRNPAKDQVHDRAAMIALELRIPALAAETRWVAAARDGDVVLSAWRARLRPADDQGAPWTEARFGSVWETGPAPRLLRHVRLVDPR